jgi:hypothetical protein
MMSAHAKFAAILLLLTLLLTLAPPLRADGIVVSNDEWMFTNQRIGTDNDAQFATDIAGWLTGGSGNILILSNNFGLEDTGLSGLLTTLGYGVTVTSTAPASLAGYAAVFVGGAADEAAAWNPFLNAFGLGLATSYNGVTGDIDVSAFQTQHPYGPALFAGVNTVYVDNGNNVSIVGLGPNGQVFTDAAGNGLYSAVQTGVPEPTSLLLLAGPLLALGLKRSRKRAA